MFASCLHIFRGEGNVSGVGEDLKALMIFWHLVDLDMCHEDLYINYGLP